MQVGDKSTCSLCIFTCLLETCHYLGIISSHWQTPVCRTWFKRIWFCKSQLDYISRKAHSCGFLWAWTCVDIHPKLNPSKLNHLIKMNQNRRKKAIWGKKELRKYDQTPFVNTRSRSSRFILTGPLPICCTCIYSRGPLATPPWPDGDHKRLHNGDCVHSLNDRPVHTSYKESPPPSTRHTYTKNNWTA